MAAIVERIIEMADGARIGYREGGDPGGQPLLWFHGGLSSSVEVEFLDQAAQALGLRVIGLDRPGIGASSLTEGGPLVDWAAAVADCADRLGIESFSVAGWSAGGPYALACALRLGARVRSATTVAGMYPVTDRSRRGELGLLADRLLIPLAHARPALAGLALQPFRVLPDRVLWSVTTASAPPAERRDLAGADRDVITRMLKEAVRQGPAGVVADYRRFGGDWGFRLAEVKVPVTVLQGSADGMLPPQHASLLAAELADADLRVIVGASHFLPMTHPEAVLGAV